MLPLYCYVRSNDKSDKTKAAYWLLSAGSVDKELLCA